MRKRAFFAGFSVAFALCGAVSACVGEDIAPIPPPAPEPDPRTAAPSGPAEPTPDDEDAHASPPDAIAPPPDAGDGGDAGVADASEAGCDASAPSKLAQPCGAGGAACEQIFESCCKGQNGISCVGLESLCTNGGGTVLACTKTADCTVPGKTKCCAALLVPKGTCAEPILQAGSTCRSSCGVTETELCNSDPLACPSGKSCLGATVHVGKDSVRVGRCGSKTP